MHILLWLERIWRTLAVHVFWWLAVKPLSELQQKWERCRDKHCMAPGH